MIRSAKQRRFLEATEAARGYVPGAVAPSPNPAAAPLTMPGGAVRGGGYLATAKFKQPSMPGLRKVRG